MRRVLLTGCLLFSAAAEAEPLPGPIPADVVRVVDGDTIRVRAHIWPNQQVEVSVRLARIDAPEINRPGCDAERAPAQDAMAAVESLVGERIQLRQVRHGRYADRVIAEAITADGISLSDYLLARGLAVAYGASGDWCEGA